MRLRSAPASPFARKIRIAIHVAGLAGDVEIVDTNTREASAEFLLDNPLGKIPTLIVEDGTRLYDSRVIAAYLDERAGRGILFPEGLGRIAVLKFEALADGIMDALVLQAYERHWRAEERREPRWIAHQSGKVERGLAEADRLIHAELPSTPIHIGHIALAAALGYLDLRFDGVWRLSHPSLAAWLGTFAQRVPAYDATRFEPR